MWGALIQAAAQIVPQITGKMEADRTAKVNSAQHKLDTGVAVNADLEESARVIGRAATLAAASGGGLTGSALSVIEDLSRQAMARARNTAYTGVSEAADLARGTITRAQLIGAGTRAVTPLLTEWAGQERWGGGGSATGFASSTGQGVGKAFSGFASSQGG